MSCCCRHSDPDRDFLRDPGLNCCFADNPFIPKKRICCDGDCCGLFTSERRDCFWPDFSHPQWLCCRILYGCPALEDEGIFDDRIRDDRRDRDDEEKGCEKHHHCCGH